MNLNYLTRVATNINLTYNIQLYIIYNNLTYDIITPPAEGPGGEGGDRLGSAPPQKSTQSPDRLYKAPKQYTKPRQTIQRSRKTIQSP